MKENLSLADWALQQVVIQKAQDEYFLKVLAVATEYGGTAWQVHDEVDCQVPKENYEAALLEIKGIHK